MSAVDDTVADVLERVGLTQRATVYTGSTWSTVATSDLPCNLDPVQNRQSAQTGGARTELANRGTLEWARSFTMPVGARVVVNVYGAQRWTVVAGTVWPSFGPGGGLLSWSAEVVRAG